MQTIFSTEGVTAKDRFRLWREICESRLVPMAQNYLGNHEFHASIEGTSIGGLGFTKFALSDLRASTTQQTIRHQENKSSSLFMSLVASGTVCSEHNGRSVRDAAGDFSIRDTSVPWTIEHAGASEVLAIEIPRDRLETVLGSARHFAGLTVSGNLPTTVLARSFLFDLLRVERQLTPQAAERMTSVAVDLIAASLAEQMALETPRSLHGTLIVQRAKAHIEANLGRFDLDPAHVAAAVGVSLRHLQGLFRENGHNVSAWIWQRRLESAARRLSDPAWLHVRLGELAYGSGFMDQAHFSRRFRARYGMSPREFRHMALARAARR